MNIFQCSSYWMVTAPFYFFWLTMVTFFFALFQAGKCLFPGLSQILENKVEVCFTMLSSYFPYQQNTPHMFWFFYERNTSFQRVLSVGKVQLNIVIEEKLQLLYSSWRLLCLMLWLQAYLRLNQGTLNRYFTSWFQFIYRLREVP